MDLSGAGDIDTHTVYGHRWVREGAGMKNADETRNWIASMCAPVLLALWLVVGGCGQGGNAPNEKEGSTSPETTAVSGAGPETTADGSSATATAAPRSTLQVSAPRRLTNDLDGYAPFSLSDEGDKVAFSNPRDDDIYVINSDGTNLTNVTEGAALGSQPTFTPDGDEIIFPVDHNNGNTDIYVVNSDGTNLTNVTETKAAREEDPAVSPDGNQIVFVRIFDTPNPPPRSEVYVMDTDGTKQKRLTNDAAIKLQPTFSPGGEKIAFTRSDLRNPPAWPKTNVVNADGSDMHELVEGVPLMEQFTFSPDGENIAFTAPARTGFRRVSPEEVSDIYVANFDGSDLTRLTYKSGFDGEPAFVPGTDMVAFVSERDGDRDIYAIRLDGTGLTNLIDTDSADEGAPAFSADGTRMAYVSIRRDNIGSEGEIYMMNIEETTDSSDSARQEGKRVTFSPGSQSATLKGSVVRGERDEYLLDARAGQQMSVRISSLEDNAVFQIYEPGRNRTLPRAGERDDAREWSGELPTSGDYTIVVGGTRGNATYTLRVTIT
jgi:Tol biopolymer transport system component